MAKIALTEGFSLIPEGTHIFKIIEVSYTVSYTHLTLPTT